MMKRTFAVLLALCMVFSVFTAFASELVNDNGDLYIDGVLLLNAEGGRAETLEEAVNIPESYLKEQEERKAAEQKAAEQKEYEQKIKETTFVDIPSDNLNVEAIAYMKEKGIMIGYTDGTFKPENIVTRAEFVKMLIEIDGGIADIPDGTPAGFSDVDTPTPHWAQKYIYAGVKKGYLLGMGDGTFAPDSTITYEQAMKILVCYVGKELAAKTKAANGVELWPTAYVVTGEQLELNRKVPLVVGNFVNRSFIAQLTYNAIKVYSPNNNVNTGVVGGGGSGGGGGGSSGGGGGGSSSGERYTPDGRILSKEDIYTVSGQLVSIADVCIDVETDAVTDPFILIKSDEDGSYVKLRVPSTGPSTVYDSLLGYYVVAEYFKNAGGLMEVLTFKTAGTSKTIVVDAKNIKRAKSDKTQIAFLSGTKTDYIKIPENLSDLKVVYNGVPVDRKHPPADYTDNTFTTPMITLDDLMPEVGTVSFVKNGAGEVDLAIINTYDTVVAESSVSSTTGIVTDKHDKNHTYILDENYLLSVLRSKPINSGRDIKESDVDITFEKSGSTSTAEIKASSISKNNVLNIYASKDRTKIKVVISTAYAGGTSSAQRITTEFDPDEEEVSLKGIKHKVSKYLINVMQGYEGIAELFPLGSYVVARVDSFGAICDVEEKEPTYEYGFLSDVEYEKKNAETGKPSLSFRIVTYSNYSKYSNPDDQTYVPATKFKINDVSYDSDNYEKAEAALKASAASINGTRKAASLTHADYAQPIRIEFNDSSSKQIKTIVTMENRFDDDGVTQMHYDLDSYSYYSSKITSETTSSSYALPGTAVVFSVPDDILDFEAYKVTKGTGSFSSYSKHIIELYKEKVTSTSGTVTYPFNCLVMFDESLTSMPVVSSTTYPSIVKKITKEYEDGETTVKFEVYEPTSVTSTATKTYTVERDSVAGGKVYAVNTHREIDVGDVIMFGTTADKKYIKNVTHILDVSNRQLEGFVEMFDAYGKPTASEASARFYRRYGTVTGFDESLYELLLDVDDEYPVLIENNSLINTSKPIYFSENEDSGKPEVTAPGKLFKDEELTRVGDPGAGSLLFVFSTSSSSTSTETFKTVYVIDRAFRDSYYSEDEATSKETVEFDVNPKGATVTLSNKRNKQITFTETDENEDGVILFENIESGVYTYTVTKDNYEPYTLGTFVINYNEAPVPQSIKLDRSEGSLVVVFTKADPTVTGTPRGLVKLTLSDDPTVEATSTVSSQPSITVPVGIYDYVVTVDGYHTETGIVNITKDSTKRLSITVNPVAVKFTVPDGSKVTVNKVTKTATGGEAVFYALAKAEYSYLLTLDGYLDYGGLITVTDENQEITVSEDMLTGLYTVTLNITDSIGSPIAVGTVDFGSTSGIVFNDGTLEIPNVEAGEYAYTIKAEGYEDASGIISVGEEFPNSLSAALTANPE